MLDLRIDNVRICDGSGEPVVTGSVGVEKGKIAAVGSVNEAACVVIDGKGMDLAPGFIDAHSHGDTQIWTLPSRYNALKMGVTTEITGQCGSTYGPAAAEMPQPAREHLTAGNVTLYEDFGDMLDKMQAIGPGTNMACFVGHGILRAGVIGMKNRPATADELERMKALLATAMEQGAMGMTTGLVYAPGCNADTEELIELAKVAARYGGIYSTHMRDEHGGLVESVREAIRIAREADIQTNISHFKALGLDNTHLLPEAVKLIEDALAEGLKITFDVYPYTASSAGILSTLPPSYLEHDRDWLVEHLTGDDMIAALEAEIHRPDGWNNTIERIGYENDLIAVAPKTPQWQGMRLNEIAEKMGVRNIEAYCRIIAENRGQVRDIRFQIDEDWIGRLYSHPRCMVGSDGVYKGEPGFTHPRAFGTMTRYLGRFIRDKKLMSLEAGVRKCTGMPADVYGLKGKGYIRVGCDADMVLFDPDTIIDRADYADPYKNNEGIHMVFVGGQAAVVDNELTGVRNGKILRRA